MAEEVEEMEQLNEDEAEPGMPPLFPQALTPRGVFPPTSTPPRDEYGEPYMWSGSRWVTQLLPPPPPPVPTDGVGQPMRWDSNTGEWVAQSASPAARPYVPTDGLGRPMTWDRHNWKWVSQLVPPPAPPPVTTDELGQPMRWDRQTLEWVVRPAQSALWDAIQWHQPPLATPLLPLGPIDEFCRPIGWDQQTSDWVAGPRPYSSEEMEIILDNRWFILSFFEEDLDDLYRGMHDDPPPDDGQFAWV